MSPLKTERVIIHTFDGQAWSKVSSEIHIESSPFSSGALRQAYKAQQSYPAGSPLRPFVIKMAIDKTTSRNVYSQDVEAQVYAKSWALKFNESIMNKEISQIEFVDAFVVELAERTGRPLTGCEPYIEGNFTKHNNNVGSVVDTSSISEKESSDLASAFSHFTFARSNYKILICDIQGVGTQYTDPQIHTSNGKGFGVGNLGITGIKAFLLRHVCSAACRVVGLAPVVDKDINVNNMEDLLFDEDVNLSLNTENSNNNSKLLEQLLDENHTSISNNIRKTTNTNNNNNHTQIKRIQYNTTQTSSHTKHIQEDDLDELLAELRVSSKPNTNHTSTISNHSTPNVGNIEDFDLDFQFDSKPAIVQTISNNHTHVNNNNNVNNTSYTNLNRQTSIPTNTSYMHDSTDDFDFDLSQSPRNAAKKQPVQLPQTQTQKPPQDIAKNTDLDDLWDDLES